MSAETSTTQTRPQDTIVPTTESFPSGVRRARMTGRVVFVTGGTRGIGAAISRSFAEQGAAVAAGYSRDREQAEGLVRQLEENDMLGSIHQGNVGSAEDCRRTVNEVLERYGRLDVLVNNAGIIHVTPIADEPTEAWKRLLDVNLTGAFFGIRAVIPAMTKGAGGSIINVSSIFGPAGAMGYSAYAASTAGLLGLTRTAALELAPAEFGSTRSAPVESARR